MRPSVALNLDPPSEGDRQPWQRAWDRALEGSLPEGARFASVSAPEPAETPALPADEPARAGQALSIYQRALGLPPGPERNELARLALGELYQGDARVFVALATRMASGPGRWLEGAGVKPRLALALSMPLAWGLGAPELALALVRRPELCRRFVTDALDGGLPERALAARLLERAALGAIAERVGVEAFGEGSASLDALARLADDPDPPVWSAAACARGLLAPRLGPLAGEFTRGLDPSAGSRAFARSLTSLVASLASGPPGAMRALRHAIGKGGALEPSALAGAVSALASVAELRPELAAEALSALLAAGSVRPDAALGAALGRLDEPLRAVARSHALAPRPEGPTERALWAYLNEGPGPARSLALGAAQAAQAALEARPPPDFTSLQARVAPLLDDGSLAALLSLVARDAEGFAAVEDVYDRLTELALAGDEPPKAAGLAPRLARRWRLRALAHLADAPPSPASAGDPRRPADASLAERGRQRRERVARAALARLAAPGPGARSWAAAFARAVGRLAGEGAWDELDVALLIAEAGLGRGEVAMIFEASARGGMRALLSAWLGEGGPGPVARLADEFGRRASPRALSAGFALDSFARATGALAAVASLEACAEAGCGPGPLAALARAAAELERPIAEARLRTGLPHRPLRPSPPLLGLHALLERALRTGDRGEFDLSSSSAAEALAAALPGPLGEGAAAALRRLTRLPAYARPSRAPRSRPGGTLPPWMPPNRTVGGFYLERALGRGASGTVFVARRSDDRHDPRAPRFALKVPSGTRAEPAKAELVERLMRDEAVALLALPEHPNLARLVTVDLSTRPGPVVVTELIDGVSVEQLLADGRLEMSDALGVLVGLLEGLATMHESGIGHLDLKPSNVVVRPDGSPVLVDFGLAGRVLRPGYLSGPYAAPEAWGAMPEGDAAGPPAADMYAFACFAFEATTGRALFEADSNVAMLAAHLTHDGWPPRLAALARDPALSPFASLLARALRRDPRARPTAREVAAEFVRLAPALAALPWPLVPCEQAALGFAAGCATLAFIGPGTRTAEPSLSSPRVRLSG